MKSYLTFKQLAYITGIGDDTIRTYCQGWLLCKYLGLQGTYEYTQDSINRLYTYLYLKRKREAMERLKNCFNFAKLVEVE